MVQTYARKKQCKTILSQEVLYPNWTDKRYIWNHYMPPKGTGTFQATNRTAFLAPLDAYGGMRPCNKFGVTFRPNIQLSMQDAPEHSSPWHNDQHHLLVSFWVPECSLWAEPSANSWWTLSRHKKSTCFYLSHWGLEVVCYHVTVPVILTETLKGWRGQTSRAH